MTRTKADNAERLIGALKRGANLLDHSSRNPAMDTYSVIMLRYDVAIIKDFIVKERAFLEKWAKDNL